MAIVFLRFCHTGLVKEKLDHLVKKTLVIKKEIKGRVYKFSLKSGDDVAVKVERKVHSAM